MNLLSETKVFSPRDDEAEARLQALVRSARPWTPDDLVRALVQYCLDNPDTLIRGIHLFPFGGLRQSAQWLQQHSGSLEDQRGRFHESSVQ